MMDETMELRAELDAAMRVAGGEGYQRDSVSGNNATQ